MNQINIIMIKFKGFNTINQKKAPFTLTGSALVKRDLLNELYTKKGERVMRPDYGSIIWDLIMDPSTADMDTRVEADIKKIIDRDPRAELININVLVLDHTIRAEVDIKILPEGDVEQLYLEYKRDLLEGTE